MAECKHEIELSQCTMCAPAERVYVSGGGTHFHRLRGCGALADGQHEVFARGGTPSAVTLVSESEASFGGRFPCRSCA